MAPPWHAWFLVVLVPTFGCCEYLFWALRMADTGDVNDHVNASDANREEISNGLNSAKDRDYSDSLNMSPVIAADMQRWIRKNNALVQSLIQAEWTTMSTQRRHFGWKFWLFPLMSANILLTCRQSLLPACSARLGRTSLSGNPWGKSVDEAVWRPHLLAQVLPAAFLQVGLPRLGWLHRHSVSLGRYFSVCI